MALLSVDTGNEGPRYDPYSFTRINFTGTDGTSVVFHCGLAVWMTVNGVKLDFRGDVAPACQLFDLCTGLSPDDAERIYWSRLHTEDPMGPASRYE